MNDSNPPPPPAESARPAPNNGKLTGPKPPLRARPRVAGQAAAGAVFRDLALFNLAIDSKLRGCGLVALRVDDVAPNFP
jgi:hypothetical protein